MRPSRVLALLLVAAVAAWWAIPSDVARLVAKTDEVYLGRYSESRIYLLLFWTPIALLLAWWLWCGAPFHRAFRHRLSAVLLGSIAACTAVDGALRIERSPRYVLKTVKSLDHWPHKFRRLGAERVKCRPPGARYVVRYVDEPTTARTYDPAPPGFPPVEVTLTVDERGFRNPRALDRADVVTIGDSFTEGSRVSDDEAWPALVRAALGRPLYNLAVSGTSPDDYLAAWLAFGEQLGPEVVLVCVFEGNDLRESESEREYPFWRRIYEAAQDFVKDSPLNDRMREFLEDTLTPIGAKAPLPAHPGLSWMPARISGPEGTWYASFEPKEVVRLFVRDEEFASGRGWRLARERLAALFEAIRGSGAQPICVYAPTKAHVVLPLVWDEVPAEAIRAFAAFKERDLPPGPQFVEELRARIDAKQRVVERFCREQGVLFLPVTEPLRAEAARGVQVYYTYDDHWTKFGHRVVGRRVIEEIRGRFDASR